ncbi:monoamine oxidase [Dinghuibacter silviterrae]|uniref:Monoamine oxidase n=2 Tax=Dinghuibacter silviterrae TaxID=1539049 RepID=A0A4V3GLC8_9BACT|nr:monoamine oxidase [Dinghuibacter silviterrae]
MYCSGFALRPQLAGMKSTKRVVIVGGGLSGMTLAYRLRKEKLNVTILEAASRLGGRIQTIAGKLGTPLELGATWFADQHSQLTGLLDELGLEKYPQFSEGISLFQTKSFEPAQQFHVPAGDIPSYRVAGGTEALIDALAGRLGSATVLINRRVNAIKDAEEGLIVETCGGEVFGAHLVVVCIPPQLAAATIAFSPELPSSVRDVLPQVQTWMAGAVKFVLEYATPFWREKGYSGMLYSHAGIITEMYDHTNKQEDRFGFTGFLAGSAAGYSPAVRQELVLHQLTVLLGEEAGKPTAYFDRVWNDDLVVSGHHVVVRPHQNQGHPSLQLPYMNGKLFLCSTEVAQRDPGYMEGAVYAATSVAERIAFA